LIEVGTYIKAEMNFKPASFGRQNLTFEGEVTDISENFLMLHTGTLIPKESELMTIEIYPNVKSFERHKEQRN